MLCFDDRFLRLYDQLLSTNPGSCDRMQSTILHNKAVGGAPASGHLLDLSNGVKCCAADLQFDSIEDLKEAAKEALVLGFDGVELDLTNNHLHVDTKSRPHPWQVVHLGAGKELPLFPWLAANVAVTGDV